MLRLMMLPLLAYGNNETSIPYNLAWCASTGELLCSWPVTEL